jgi:hypothetical protein
VARYFFHVRDSVELLDEEGIELPGLNEVRTEAIVAAGEMLKDLDGRFWDSPDWRLWVTDEAGQTVCTLRFLAEAG